MKVLSLTQPMAYAVVALGKNIENRGRSTHYRGVFYIHASKGFNVEHYNWILEHYERLGLNILNIPMPGQFIHAAIIGQAELVAVVNYHPSLWFTGPHGYLLKNGREYKEPI